MSARWKTMQVRVAYAEVEGFKEAADRMGLTVSAWIRMRLKEAAIREAEAVGRVSKCLGVAERK